MKKECPNGRCTAKMERIEQIGNRVRYKCNKCGTIEDVTENGK